MRILVIHAGSSHSLTGEDLAAESQIQALREFGHEVRVFPGHNERIGRVDYARGLNPALVRVTNLFRPDIIHLHKWFPDMGRHNFRSLGAPIVATLHNFRPLCPVGTLFRRGEFCTQCVDRNPWALVLHGCHTHGRLYSTVTAASRPGPGSAHPFFRTVDRFIAPSARAAEVFERFAGLDRRSVDVVPSFVERPNFDHASPNARRGLLYVGQLEETKGIRELVACLPINETLTVVGGGSLKRELRRLSPAGCVNFVGVATKPQVYALMRASEILIFPSRYLETQGLVVGEAAAAGTPVVAVAGTAGADQVRDHTCGVVIDSISGLAPALKAVRANVGAFRAAALKYWSSYLTREAWLHSVTSVYERALASARNPKD